MRFACSCNWATLLLQVNCTFSTHTNIHIQKDILHNCHQSSDSDLVTNLNVNDSCLYTGFSYAGRADSYQMSTWFLGEKYIKDYNGWFLEQQTQFLLGRYLLNLVLLLSLVYHQHFDESLEFIL